MAIKIKDVAKKAGVGVGTVSRVLNNSNTVKPATRDKVLQTIKELSYHPDPIARSMVVKTTGTIAIIVPFFTRPFQMEVLRGVSAAANREGLELVIFNIENQAQQDDCFNRLPMRRKADGILIISLSLRETFIEKLSFAGIPVVMVDAYNPNLCSIVVNNIEGAQKALTYLIKQGHRRIGFINGEIEGNFKFNQANDRLIGYHRALGEAGIEFDPELIQSADWSKEGGKEAALRLLNLASRPTAIFVASDVMAVGVVRAARELNLRIPGDLALLGYDGTEASELLDITTIKQPMIEMGEIGLLKLIEQIKEPATNPQLIQLGTQLVERKSTASPD